MPTPEENYLLLWSLLQQKMSASGQLEGIDWAIVGQNLGIDRAGTVSVRWIRLKEEFSKLGFPGLPDKSNGQSVVGKAGMAAHKTKVTKDTKNGNPKARSAVEKKGAGSKTKARKNTKQAEGDEEEDGVKAGDEETGSHGDAE